MVDAQSSAAPLQLSPRTWRLIYGYERPEPVSIQSVDWSEHDNSWILYAETGLTRDELTESERKLWDNTEGIEREYAAKQIDAFRDLEHSEPMVIPDV